MLTSVYLVPSILDLSPNHRSIFTAERMCSDPFGWYIKYICWLPKVTGEKKISLELSLHASASLQTLVGEGVHALQCSKIILDFFGLACDGIMIN